jgi:hypothetical protein
VEDRYSLDQTHGCEVALTLLEGMCCGPSLVERSGWTSRRDRRRSPVAVVPSVASSVYSIPEDGGIQKRLWPCTVIPRRKSFAQERRSKNRNAKDSRYPKSSAKGSRVNVSDQVCPTRTKHKFKDVSVRWGRFKEKDKMVNQFKGRKRNKRKARAWTVVCRYLMH